MTNSTTNTYILKWEILFFTNKFSKKLPREACILTDDAHPVSIFSKIHSSKEKDFTSVNDITFSVMECGDSLFGKATFVIDRGYDDRMFLKLDALGQDYVIRLTVRRKLLLHGKWVPVTRLCS